MQNRFEDDHVDSVYGSCNVLQMYHEYRTANCFQVWREQLAREQEEVMCLSGDGRRQVDKASTTKDTTGRRVHPVDAPRGSLRARLFKQMTATEGSSKAAVSDLIFNLCEDEGELYTVYAKGFHING